jgi:ubiquinone biosynthesis monooxygenase Coq7
MKGNKRFSVLDELILNVDRVVKTLSAQSITPVRPSPATAIRSKTGETEATLNESVRSHIGGLMRVNHTGEVCAQALYQGQALTARNEQTRSAMQQSAIEEEDHLAWCEQRLTELNSHTSYLNPLFYAMSFGIGAAAGLVGDKWSLGFIAATEDQVCAHLRSHLSELPEQDKKSRAIIEQMIVDEEQHGQNALNAGGAKFSKRQTKLMSAVSKLMTRSAYKI